MSHFGFSFVVGALVLAAVASTACTHNTTVHVRAPERVALQSKCVDTECDAGRRAASVSKAFEDCIAVASDACDYAILCPDFEQTCALECATEKCYAASPCIQYSWTAQIQNAVATPGVEEACQAAYAPKSTRCGVKLTDENLVAIDAECTNAAVTSTEAGVAYYTCLGASACGKAAACDQPSSFGAELCSMPMGSCLSSCQDPDHGGLDGLGSRLKPALLDAARTCMNQTTCEAVTGCIAAWQKLLED